MYPIIWRTEWGFVYAYTLVMGSGLLLSLWWLLHTTHVARSRQLERFAAIFLGGIIGGRATFVIGNLPYYAENLAEAWRWWAGGLGYFGVLWGGLLGGWLWARWRQRPFLPPLSHLTLPLIGLHAAGWFACLLDGCAYGATTTLSWYTVDWPDSYGVYGLRTPVQLLGILAAGVILLLTWRVPRTPATFWLALSLLLLGHTVLTLLRGDQMPLLGTWRIDTLAGTISFLVTLNIFIFVSRGLHRPDFV